ncbi:MAG: hypothetical protein JRJ37_07790 [Deltaproteobacteria bacterium]|nr:hypothetical protein [Deltaproteobacteria bacterium]
MTPETCLSLPKIRHTMKNFRQVILLLLLGTVFFLDVTLPASANEGTSPATGHDYAVINGEWQRTDGGYLIKISDVQADGLATVKYFNPSPIHVAQTTISTQKELIKLFIKFQDKGYEGSTYTLYYYAEKDALVGFYYQAVMDKTFKVIFVRKTN